MEDVIIKRRLAVDAGCIAVLNLSYIEANGGKFTDCAKAGNCRKVSLPKGEYEVTVHIKNTYNGNVEETFKMKTDGVVVIGDACYYFSDDNIEDKVWHNFLNKTDYLNGVEDNMGSSISTGGDGSFMTIVTFKKI